MTVKVQENPRGRFEECRKRFRSVREAGYYRLFTSRSLCVAGLCAMPALLFNPDTAGRIGQFLLFWFLAWLAGKKNNPLITVLVVLSITAFNLLVPYGRVLVSLGAFSITEGALMTGIRRAVTLEGLIMLSRTAIRRDLRFPGSFGALIGESFQFLALIRDRRQHITRKNWMGDIDRLLIELSETPFSDIGPGSAGGPPVNRNRTTIAGYVILTLAFAAAWVPWLFAAGKVR
jgi:heptaprenyl diphosphate synthase